MMSARAQAVGRKRAAPAWLLAHLSVSVQSFAVLFHTYHFCFSLFHVQFCCALLSDQLLLHLLLSAHLLLSPQLLLFS